MLGIGRIVSAPGHQLLVHGRSITPLASDCIPGRLGLATLSITSLGGISDL
jgi:hypothetical protein